MYFLILFQMFLPGRTSSIFPGFPAYLSEMACSSDELWQPRWCREMSMSVRISNSNVFKHCKMTCLSPFIGCVIRSCFKWFMKVSWVCVLVSFFSFSSELYGFLNCLSYWNSKFNKKNNYKAMKTIFHLMFSFNCEIKKG